MSTVQECSVCKACGCGTALYVRNNQLYCNAHLPSIVSAGSSVKRDDQLLTLQQKSNLR